MQSVHLKLYRFDKPYITVHMVNGIDKAINIHMNIKVYEIVGYQASNILNINKRISDEWKYIRKECDNNNTDVCLIYYNTDAREYRHIADNFLYQMLHMKITDRIITWNKFFDLHYYRNHYSTGTIHIDKKSWYLYQNMSAITVNQFSVGIKGNLTSSITGTFLYEKPYSENKTRSKQPILINGYMHVHIYEYASTNIGKTIMITGTPKYNEYRLLYDFYTRNPFQITINLTTPIIDIILMTNKLSNPIYRGLLNNPYKDIVINYDSQ